ncbi:MAG TPA: indole-3-glycerol phosphate synthase TrpC [Solirubrobacteraceae bacterium]|nr:indole-3-glycerol phosphate synthase TrpC [Solirubrobacteraceae bacterium]
MSSVLETIVATTRADLALRKARVPLEALAAIAPPARPGGAPTVGFRESLAGPGIALIAEFKRASPSAGAIRPGADVASVARAYEAGGAAAMSVLTEERQFLGSLADLRDAAAACRLPLLRKDFVVDPYQIHEARSAGAAAILLIVAALDEPLLRDLHETARELSLDAVVEVHDAAELEVAKRIGAELIGVNNRDLRDFSVDPERTFALLGEMPQGALVVSESGIATAADIARLRAAGVDAVLVGERLMRGGDPAGALRELAPPGL